ncbi:Ribosomal large subunit pseudouridine synthase D [Commensalibacter sp. Nvir]|uniref:RluA family pseudouridine synthase n=1 Tax=Commensalibacter sp. Nvir TaxID=3069817 RepID=UPI002D5BEFD4|nr:Ribosomal large subunit pseudouridine synthase D [Commensalibacter sp. Nvir]
MSNAADEVSSPYIYTVNKENNNLRLDFFLASINNNYSRSRLKLFIQQGYCKHNSKVTTDPSLRVKYNDIIELIIPNVKDYYLEPQAIDLDIIYEDNELIVINKSANLVVHPAPGNENGTLVNALLAHCGSSLSGIGGEKRPGIVHRLDKDTTGVMVIAKTERSLTQLSAAFAARKIERLYYALCWGILNPAVGEIEGAIGRDAFNRKKMSIVLKGGKYAKTHYKTLSIFQQSVSLVQCKLDTGRTHQIRVHLSKSGHPLIGDSIYLKRIPAIAKKMPPTLRAMALDFLRQALHAAVLGFEHPITREYMRFETPLPEDMASLIKKLQNINI